MIVEGYSLHLYCANSLISGGTTCHSDMGEFGGDTKREARTYARHEGWRFTKGDVLCPRCARKGGR